MDEGDKLPNNTPTALYLNKPFPRASGELHPGYSMTPSVM